MARRTLTTPRRGIDDYAQVGARFNGTNNYLTLVTASTGLVDGDTGTVVLGFKRNSDGATQYLFSTTNNKFYVFFISTDKVQIVGKDSAGTTLLTKSTDTATVTADGNWHTLMISFDLANSLFYGYIDGVSVDWTAGILTSGDIEFTKDLTVGASSTPADYFDGCMSALAISNEYIDLSVQANRDAIVSTIAMLDPGSDGTNYFVTQPAILLQGQGSQFKVNSGLGSDFTLNNPELLICNP